MALDVPDLGFTPTLGQLATRAAARWGDRDFVVMPDRRLSFREAEAASRALGKRLLASGIGKGTRVGLFDTYSVEWVVTWLAITRIGALAMPFSSVYKPAELGTVLRVGDVHLLLAPTQLLGRDVADMVESAVPGLSSQRDTALVLEALPFLREVWLWGGAVPAWARPVEVLADGPAATPGGPVTDELFDAVERAVVPADWAQVTYTSGSSALPKGVVHSHGAIVRTTGSPMGVLAGGPGPLPDEPTGPSTTFCAFPFFWIGGTLVLGRALHGGTTICCLPRFEPAAALDLIEQERCTSVSGWAAVPAMRSDPSFADRDLSHIPMLTSGGGAMPTGPVAGYPGHRSMSELVGNWAGAERRAVDPDTGEVVPDLAEGELVVRGYGALQGYYKKEREETFDADGWLHTGDRVYLHENRVFFVGRFFEMVKSKGANVSPREVEVCMEGWEEIKHVFVFGTPHPTLEEEVTAVVAFMPGRSMTPEEIRARAGVSLSSYKVPTRIEVVEDESTIPWLGSGKPDKIQIRERLLRESS